MQQIARAGVLTGTCLTPILPGLCDDDAGLETLVRRIADRGEWFALADDLTLADQ